MSVSLLAASISSPPEATGSAVHQVRHANFTLVCVIRIRTYQ